MSDQANLYFHGKRNILHHIGLEARIYYKSGRITHYTHFYTYHNWQDHWESPWWYPRFGGVWAAIAAHTPPNLGVLTANPKEPNGMPD